MTLEELARTAYEAYGKHRDFKTYDGKPMPEWAALNADIRKTWEVAISAVFTALLVDLKLDQREILALRHAQQYKKEFSSAGIPGHNQFLLIAKLVDALRIE